MKPSFQHAAILIALIAGFSGFMIGRASRAKLASSEFTAQEITASTANDARMEQSQRSAPGHRPRRHNSGSKTTRTDLAQLSAIFAITDTHERSRALLAFLSRLGPHEFESAFSHFQSLGLSRNHLGEVSLFLSAWGKADPLSALEYLQAEIGNDEGGDYLFDAVLAAWAIRDPESAIRWAQEHDQGEGPNRYFAGIIRSVAENDTARATQLLMSMHGNGPAMGEAYDAILPHILAQGNEAAFAWIASLPDAQQAGVILRTSIHLGTADPDATSAWLANNPHPTAKMVMTNLYIGWASRDQQAALRSFDRLPAGEHRSKAIKGLVLAIAPQNPNSAVALLDRYPNDATDDLVSRLIAHSMNTDPAVAIGAIARIQDESRRETSYRIMLNEWLKRDTNAANAWMKMNPLPDRVIDGLGK